MISAKCRIANESWRVKQAQKRGTIRSLAQAGAYLRGFARRSIKVTNATPRFKYVVIPIMQRRGKGRSQVVQASRRVKVPVTVGASRPGKPPHSTMGDLKHSIYFEAGSSSVVIGPTWSRIGDIGRVHEFGGKRSRPSSYPQRGVWSWSGGKPRLRLDRRRYFPTYPARPFMAPALERARPRLASFWANSVVQE